MLVRPLAPTDDLARLGDLVAGAYLALPDYPDTEMGYLETVRDVEGRAADPDTIVAVAELDGRSVGCITFVTGPASPHAEHGDPEATSFRYFGVDPAAQGRGVGEAVVRWCIDETRRLGRPRIVIHTLAAMVAAQRLYVRLGFVRDPEHDEEWDGVPGLAYRLDL